MVRVIQRPLLPMVDELDKFMILLRSTGQAVGMEYPPEAPVKVDPACPRDFKDHLEYTSYKEMSPLPEMTPVLSGVSSALSEEDRNVILKNAQLNDVAMRDYRDRVVEHYLNLFQMAGSTAQRIDNQMNFYCDLYGHVDREF